MKRFHVHVAVKDLSESVRFYSTLFAAEPTVLKSDYANWRLEDPCVNFAISTHGQAVGIDHLGIQVEDDTELKKVAGRLEQAGRPVLKQGETICCYARSDKAWITDSQGLAWEAFYTLGEASVYGEDRQNDTRGRETACCMPVSSASAACCESKEASRCGDSLV
ncbi:MAG: ArsI/CadI family heavy metal resistance metalloenzyme [Candidatus Competibacteraceae bacterium]